MLAWTKCAHDRAGVFWEDRHLYSWYLQNYQDEEEYVVISGVNCPFKMFHVTVFTAGVGWADYFFMNRSTDWLHLVPQVVVVVRVLQWRRPVLLPPLHLPVEHIDGARARLSSAGLAPRSGLDSAAGRHDPAPAAWDGSPTHCAAHGAALRSAAKSRETSGHVTTAERTTSCPPQPVTPGRRRRENLELDSAGIAGNRGTGLESGIYLDLSEL